MVESTEQLLQRQIGGLRAKVGATAAKLDDRCAELLEVLGTPGDPIAGLEALRAATDEIKQSPNIRALRNALAFEVVAPGVVSQMKDQTKVRQQTLIGRQRAYCIAHGVASPETLSDWEDRGLRELVKHLLLRARSTDRPKTRNGVTGLLDNADDDDQIVVNAPQRLIRVTTRTYEEFEVMETWVWSPSTNSTRTLERRSLMRGDFVLCRPSQSAAFQSIVFRFIDRLDEFVSRSFYPLVVQKVEDVQVGLRLKNKSDPLVFERPLRESLYGIGWGYERNPTLDASIQRLAAEKPQSEEP